MFYRYEYREDCHETSLKFVVIDKELPFDRQIVCRTDNIVHARNIAACMNLVHLDSLKEQKKEEYYQ